MLRSLFTACLVGAATALDLESEVSAPSYTSITITENGQPKTLYVAMWNSQSSGTTLKMPYNNGGTLLTTTPISPDAFYRPNLLGGSVEMDVDISTATCGCVEAFYLISAPGKDINGNYFPGTNGYYYCDANMVGGNYCPEFDIMEANKYAMATTPHSCDAPSALGFYSACDGIGKCGQNTKNSTTKDFGPSTKHKINTTKPFHLKLDFEAVGNTFTRWVNTMTQGTNKVTLIGDCATNASMSWDIAHGMAFWISNWSTTQNWLWGNLCTATSTSCNTTNIATYSNIKVVTGTANPAPPA